MKQGGGRGRAALGGADFSERATARVLHVRARGKAPCQGRTLACSAAAVGAGWTGGPEERGRGCGAAPGERAEEGGGRGEGSEISCGIGSPHPRVSGVRIRVFVLAPPPPHPTAHRRVGVLASYKWCEEVSPRSLDLGVVHDSLLILGQHARTRPGSPYRLPLARVHASRRAVRTESDPAPLAPPPGAQGEQAGPRSAGPR